MPHTLHHPLRLSLFVTSIRKFALPPIFRDAAPRVELVILGIHTFDLVLLLINTDCYCRTERQTFTSLLLYNLLKHFLMILPLERTKMLFQYFISSRACAAMYHGDVAEAW